MKQTFINRVQQMAKKAFTVSLLISLPVYAFIRILFYEFGFSYLEWSMVLVKTILSAWQIIFGSFAAYECSKGLHEMVRKFFSGRSFQLFRPSAAVVVLCVSMLLYACKGGIGPAGKKVDLVTGLATSYNGIVPNDTKMIMNDEVLNHTDIPLGAKFTILNTGITGLKAKDNKVSLGCSLTISDKQGKQILYEPDLFTTGGVFSRDSVQQLQCKVSTGAPMDWQQKYLVQVKYWDKYGTGKLENSVTISMEDEP